MRASRIIHVVSCHAEGEVGDVIVGGVPAPPGETIWEQSRWIAKDGALRDLLLNEPRGGVFRHVNLLVPAKNAEAVTGWIIMEPAHTPPMSGSNAICVATVLLETGMVPIVEPETRFKIEAPGGLIEIRAQCREGAVERVTLRNVPSFADQIDRKLDIPGLGALVVDTAYGGDSFVVVDAEALGLVIEPGQARTLAELGVRITAAANAEIGFHHPQNPDWRHISFCLFATPVADGKTTHAVAIEPGKIDRSPTGTAVSARLALLHAKGQASEGYALKARSIIGSMFQGRIDSVTTLDGRPAIVPSVTGRAWITGIHQHMLAPDDPWPRGYRLSDTWPRK